MSTALVETRMELTPLPRPSHVTHAGYDTAAQRMHVQFANGDRGSYDRVSPDMWKAFQSAESHGKWLHQNLRSVPGKHVYTQS